MRHLKSVAALATTLALAACGGGGAGDQAPKVQLSSMVSFGDSLSDVGSYATPGLLALSGGAGGKYTINGPDAKIWVERLAEQVGVPQPCAAQTGLNASGPLASLAATITNHAGCYDYAQGGSRVTEDVGVANQALLSLTPPDTSGYLGQLTVPVVTQIQRYLLANGGKFNGKELVTLLAGGNDLFINLAAAASTGPTAAVTAMGTAGAELAGYVKNLILANGAKYVVVVNLPDVSKTPFGLSEDTATQGLINTMVTTFNSQLQQGLSGLDVAYVDAYTVSRDQNANPAQYGLTNVTTPACDLSTAKNPLQSSLVCNSNNLVAGDVSHYEFADSVHPTPYGYQLLAQLVASEMAKKGWL